jgi:hypothetical protein
VPRRASAPAPRAPPADSPAREQQLEMRRLVTHRLDRLAGRHPRDAIRRRLPAPRQPVRPVQPHLGTM